MNIHGKDIKLFACNSNIPLAEKIAAQLGLPLSKCTVGTFSDGEIAVSIQETVRGSDVFVVQSTSAPVNDNLMEMLIMIDAFKRVLVGQYEESGEETSEAKKEMFNPQVQEYGTRQAEIIEFFLTDDRGVRSNAIMKGAEFTIHMKVKF